VLPGGFSTNNRGAALNGYEAQTDNQTPLNGGHFTKPLVASKQQEEHQPPSCSFANKL
jgi:hypothetical protein